MNPPSNCEFPIWQEMLSAEVAMIIKDCNQLITFEGEVLQAVFVTHSNPKGTDIDTGRICARLLQLRDQQSRR